MMSTLCPDVWGTICQKKCLSTCSCLSPVCVRISGSARIHGSIRAFFVNSFFFLFSSVTTLVTPLVPGAVVTRNQNVDQDLYQKESVTEKFATKSTNPKSFRSANKSMAWIPKGHHGDNGLNMLRFENAVVQPRTLNTTEGTKVLEKSYTCPAQINTGWKKMVPLQRPSPALNKTGPARIRGCHTPLLNFICQRVKKNCAKPSGRPNGKNTHKQYRILVIRRGMKPLAVCREFECGFVGVNVLI